MLRFYCCNHFDFATSTQCNDLHITAFLEKGVALAPLQCQKSNLFQLQV